jgi:general secretion pathway protein G
MPRLRCPYCQKTFEGNPAPSHCPYCEKAFVIPPSLRKTTFRERQRMRDKIARDSAKQQHAGLDPQDLRVNRRPTVLAGMLCFLLIVGGLLVVRANRMTEPAEASRLRREARTERELYALRVAIERFRDSTGRYPTEAEGLKALVIDPGVDGWDGNYVNVVKPDPWQTPYQYRLTSEGPELRSLGPDKLPDTADDILAADLRESP